MSDDAIPLVGDDDRVYQKPKTVSQSYLAFTAEFGEPEKIANLADEKLLDCARKALGLKNYFKQKYAPMSVVAESAAMQANAAKSALANIQGRLAEGIEKATTSILDVAVATLDQKIQGANTAQAMALCARVAEAAVNEMKKSPAKYGQPKGANDTMKQAVLHGIGLMLESFLRTESAARIECGAEAIVSLGYKEEGAYAARIERRAAIMTRLKSDTENALGWHNQEIAFWIKRAGEAMKGKEALIGQLTAAEKSALGLAPPESKIKFTGGAAGVKWTPGKPTWDGRASGGGGFGVDSSNER